MHHENSTGRAHSQPQHEVKGHHHPCCLSQLFGHDFGAVDHDQCAQVAVAEPQQCCEDHGVEVLVEHHGLDMSPGLVVAEDEEREEDGSEEDKGRQQFALGARHLDPGSDLPPTPVSKVVQEETREGREVLGAPRASRGFADRLDVGGEGREDDDGDEEDIEEAEAQEGSLLQDGAEWRDASASCEGGGIRGASWLCLILHRAVGGHSDQRGALLLAAQVVPGETEGGKHGENATGI